MSRDYDRAYERQACERVIDMGTNTTSDTGIITTDSFTMNYAKFGTGDKTMVIIPGLSIKPLSPMVMHIAKEYEVFLEDYTVYLLDRRNNAPDYYTCEAMASDTYAAIRELGVDKAYFLGTSQGGAIIMQLTLTHPEMAEALAIGSSSAYVNDMAADILVTWIDLAKKRDAVALATHMIDKIYSPATLKGRRDSLIKAFSNINEEEFVQFLHLCVNFADYDIRDRLSEIQCPTFVIGCEGDNVFGADASRFIYEGIKQGNDICEMYIYDDRCDDEVSNYKYGHAVYDEAPDFRDRVYNFFKSY